MSRTIDNWRKKTPGIGRRGRQEILPERRYPITPPSLPSTLRLKSLQLDEDLVVEGDITTSADSSSQQPSDGIPPTASPTPSIFGGPGYLAIKWAGQLNVDPVTYEVHLSTSNGFTPDSTTKVAETPASLIFLRKTAADTTLVYGTTYYVKLIAKDLDGSAPESGQASGQLLKLGDDGTGNPIGSLTLSEILSGSVLAEHLEAVVALVSSLIAGTSGTSRVEVGYGTDGAGNVDLGFIGVRAYNSAGVNTFKVDAQTGEVSIYGNIAFGADANNPSQLTNTDTMEIQKQSAGGTIMTPQLVQSTVGFSFTTTGSTATASWASPTKGGNVALIFLAIYDADGTTNNPSTPSGWTLDNSSTNLGSGDGNVAAYYLYRSNNTTPRSGSQSITLNDTVRYVMIMFEVSGITNASYVETAVASANNSDTVNSGNTSVLGSADSFVLGLTLFDSSSNPASLSQLTPSGYSAIGSAVDVRSLPLEGISHDAMSVYAWFKNVSATTAVSIDALRDTAKAAPANLFGLAAVFVMRKRTVPSKPDTPPVGRSKVYSTQDLFENTELVVQNDDGTEWFLSNERANLASQAWNYNECTNLGSAAGYAGGGMDFVSSGTGATVGGNNGNASHPGIYDVNTGTTAGGFSAVETRTPGFVSTTGDIYRGVWSVKFGATLSNSTDRFSCAVGFMNQENPRLASGIGAWVMVTDASTPTGGTNGDWALVQGNGTSLTADPLDDNGGGITVTVSTWYRIAIEWVVGTGISVWIDKLDGNGWKKKATNYNANAPASGTGCAIQAATIQKHVGTTNRNFFVDAVAWQYIPATIR